MSQERVQEKFHGKEESVALNDRESRQKKKGRGGGRGECPALRQVEEMESVKL